MKDLIDRKAGRMKLIDAPVGVFVFHDELVLKTEYMVNIDGVYIPDCYILSTGEKFWGGMKSTEDFKTKYNNLDVEVIDIIPSAQPERKKGKLLFADYETELWGESSICGLCGCSWQIDEDGRSNFCPNCGADMRGDSDDER